LPPCRGEAGEQRLSQATVSLRLGEVRGVSAGATLRLREARNLPPQDGVERLPPGGQRRRQLGGLVVEAHRRRRVRAAEAGLPGWWPGKEPEGGPIEAPGLRVRQ